MPTRVMLVLFVVCSLLWPGGTALAQCEFTEEVSASLPPPSDVGWVDDAVAPGMPDVSWSTQQKVRGTRSVHVAAASGDHAVSSTGASSPVTLETGSKLSFHLLLHPCTMPREVQVQWHSPDEGWRGAWWGEELLGGETQLLSMGTLPTGGEWVRIEIPTLDLGLEEETIDGFSVRLYDGEAWADHFAYVPPESSCTTPYAWDISRPSIDEVWLDDYLPAGLSPVEWSGEQAAAGYVSIAIPNAFGTHGVQTTGATEPILTETGSAFAFYLLLDPCAMPREVQVRWQDDVAGWKGVWWGEELIGSESQLVAQGALPPSGRWIRVEVPLSEIDLEDASVSGLEVRLFDGRAWIDAIAYIEPGCAMDAPAAPTMPAEIPWVDDSLAAGMPAVLWSTRQKASGTRSMHLPNDSYVHQIETIDATTPLVVEPEGALAFYLLLNECAVPTEVQFEWLDADNGWKGVYWGDQSIGNEYSLQRRGNVPAAGEWVRLEVPASLLALVNRPITGFRLTLYGGEAWLDRVSLVEPPPTTITSISIAPANGSVVEGEMTSFIATALLRNGTTADVSDQLFWHSSDNLVAGISAGVVTGLAPGTATLQARSANNFTASASVAVTAAPPPVPDVTQLEVTPAAHSLAAGDTVQLTATATYSDETTADESASTTWSTDDAAIATVDASGVLQAVAEGFATITGTFEGFASEMRVAVTAAGEECRSLYVKDGTRLWVFDGTSSHEILEDLDGVEMPRLSPDGDRVVYQRLPPSTGGPGSIVIANADSGIEEQVVAIGTLPVNAVLDIGWRTTGDVYLIGNVNPSISFYYEIDAATGAIGSGTASSRFSVSHDGAYLLQDEFVPRGAPASMNASVALLNGVAAYPPSTDTDYHRFALNYAWSQDDTHFAIVDTKPDDDEVAIAIVRASDQVVVSRTLVPNAAMPTELTWQASGLLVFRAANVNYRLTTAGVLSTVGRTPIELLDASVSDEDGQFPVADVRCVPADPPQLRRVATSASRSSAARDAAAPSLVLRDGVLRLLMGASSITSKAGSPVTITVTLASPAPAGGATVVLTPSTPVDGLPETLQIAEGERTAQFSFRTPLADTARLVTINARSRGLRGSIVVRIIPQSRSLEWRKR